MTINFTNFEKEEQQNIKKVFKVAQKELNLPSNLEINMVIVSPEEIKVLNNNFRQIDKVTDVLSFPMLNNLSELNNECDALLGDVNIGDIYICKERALSQAKEFGHGIKRELCFLSIHGLLHLLGYDHIKKEEEKTMFSLQDTILNKAKIDRV